MEGQHLRSTTAGAINALDSALGRTALRGAALANNLANVNTPGYKRLDVEFDAALAEAMAVSRGPAGPVVPAASRMPMTLTSAGHMAGGAHASPPAPGLHGSSASIAGAGHGQAKVVRAGGTTLRSDGNNVDIEAEMAMLAENTIYYQALVQQLNSSLDLLRLAITEGRR
jgi:flagellar basal-body rod protein FlgB